MQAACDHMLQFIWIDIRWPGNTSDYMAWSTSELYSKLGEKTTVYYYQAKQLLETMHTSKLCICLSHLWDKSQHIMMHTTSICPKYELPLNVHLEF